MNCSTKSTKTEALLLVQHQALEAQGATASTQHFQPVVSRCRGPSSPALACWFGSGVKCYHAGLWCGSTKGVRIQGCTHNRSLDIALSWSFMNIHMECTWWMGVFEPLFMADNSCLIDLIVHGLHFHCRVSQYHHGLLMRVHRNASLWVQPYPCVIALQVQSCAVAVVLCSYASHSKNRTLGVDVHQIRTLKFRWFNHA